MLQKFNVDKINNGNPVILYGAAMYGEIAFNALCALKIPVYAFCDRVQAGRKFCGLNVISPEELKFFTEAHILICATKGLKVYQIILKVFLISIFMKFLNYFHLWNMTNYLLTAVHLQQTSLLKSIVTIFLTITVKKKIFRYHSLHLVLLSDVH